VLTCIFILVLGLIAVLLAVLELTHRFRLLGGFSVLLVASFSTFLIITLWAVGIAVEVAAALTTNEA
jgi:hypothetical protein